MEELRFLEEQQVAPKLLEEVEAFRREYPVSKEAENRVAKPPVPYYGREILEMAISALLEGEELWGIRQMAAAPQKEDFLSFSPYIHPSVMFRREVFEKYGLYDTSDLCRRCEDYELFMRLHSRGSFGYNLKATDMQAAVGCAQIEKFPEFVERRKHNFRRLTENLASLTDFFILPEPLPGSDPSWFGYLITCKKGVDRSKVVDHLESNGVQTRMLFAGNIIRHPCFDEMRASGRGFRVVGNLDNTDRIMNDTFWIGVYPGMTDEMIDRMCQLLKESVGCAQ